MAEVNKKRWEKPGEREKMSERSKELWSNAGHRNKISAYAIKQWAETDMREVVSKAIKKSMKTRIHTKEFKEMVKRNGFKTTNNPENIAKMVRGTKRNWEDPAYREKMRLATEKNWDDPAFREKVRKTASETMTRSWKDPVYREKKLKEFRNRRFLTKGPTKPEKLMMSLLDELGVEYAYEENIYDGYKSAVPDFTVDGNIIEVLGSYHHGNPDKYKVEAFDEIQKKTLSNDLRKHELYASLGIRVIYIWDKELKEDFEVTKEKVSRFLNGENFETWYR